MGQFFQVETLCFATMPAAAPQAVLPVVMMSGAFPARMDCAALALLIEDNGWGLMRPDVPHLDAGTPRCLPGTHLAIAVCGGRIAVEIDADAAGTRILEAGDCLVLPAGTRHLIRRLGPDSRYCLAFPDGALDSADADGCDCVACGPDCTPHICELPYTDPIFGLGGPLLELWWAEAEGRPARVAPLHS